MKIQLDSLISEALSTLPLTTSTSAFSRVSLLLLFCPAFPPPAPPPLTAAVCCPLPPDAALAPFRGVSSLKPTFARRPPVNVDCGDDEVGVVDGGWSEANCCCCCCCCLELLMFCCCCWTAESCELLTPATLKLKQVIVIKLITLRKGYTNVGVKCESIYLLTNILLSW